jgi:hypothetical protein
MQPTIARASETRKRFSYRLKARHINYILKLYTQNNERYIPKNEENEERNPGIVVDRGS